MRSSDEAVAYLKKLHQIVVYLGICDGNLEEGSFRCDANVSLRPVGQEKLGTRAEIKNVNSFRFVKQAIEYEIERQIELLEDGGTVVQETRLFDPRQRHDPLHARQGRGARLPLLPRSRPGAAGDRCGLGRSGRAASCRNCPKQARSAIMDCSSDCRPTMPRC